MKDSLSFIANGTLTHSSTRLPIRFHQFIFFSALQTQKINWCLRQKLILNINYLCFVVNYSLAGYFCFSFLNIPLNAWHVSRIDFLVEFVIPSIWNWGGRIGPFFTIQTKLSITSRNMSEEGINKYTHKLNDADNLSIGARSSYWVFGCLVSIAAQNKFCANKKLQQQQN